MDQQPLEELREQGSEDSKQNVKILLDQSMTQVDEMTGVGRLVLWVMGQLGMGSMDRKMLMNAFNRSKVVYNAMEVLQNLSLVSGDSGDGERIKMSHVLIHRYMSDAGSTRWGE